MRAWDDKQIARFKFRHGLFMRRGLSDADAEQLADRLAARDSDRDDRRCCLECRYLQRGGTCFISAKGRMPGIDRRHQPVTNVLQRCDHFEFQTP